MHSLIIAQNRPKGGGASSFTPWLHPLSTRYYLGSPGNIRSACLGGSDGTYGMRLVLYMSNNANSKPAFSPFGGGEQEGSTNIDLEVSFSNYSGVITCGVTWGNNYYVLIPRETSLQGSTKVILYINLPTPDSNGAREIALYRLDAGGKQIRMAGESIREGGVFEYQPLFLFRYNGYYSLNRGNIGIDENHGVYQLTSWYEDAWDGTIYLGNDIVVGDEHQAYDQANDYYQPITGDGTTSIHDD